MFCFFVVVRSSPYKSTTFFLITKLFIKYIYFFCRIFILNFDKCPININLFR
jgi:hypothetical protein